LARDGNSENAELVRARASLRQKFIYFVEFMSGRNRGPTELRRRAENDPGGGEFEESVPRELKPVGFCEVVPF
jgi:hypothetical protein